MNRKRISTHILLLIPSAVFFTSLWTILVVGRLYYSTDSVPILDFIPPFVRPQFGELYNVNEPFVWIVWLLFVVLIFLVPHYVLKKGKTRLFLFLAFIAILIAFFLPPRH